MCRRGQLFNNAFAFQEEYNFSMERKHPKQQQNTNTNHFEYNIYT